MRILLPEGSSMSARDIVFALGRDHDVDVLDPSGLAQLRYSSLVDRFDRCPSFWREPQAYLDFLIERLQRHQYDVLLPSHEQVYLLSRCRDQLAPLTGLAVPEFETLNQMQSKASFQRLMDELSLPTPPTQLISSAQEMRDHDAFPVFVKVDYSTAGNGVTKVTSREQMDGLASELEQQGLFDSPVELLLQQPMTGKQCMGLGIFQEGRMVGCVKYHVRRPGKGGWGMNGESVHHPSVIEHLECLGSHLNFHGAFFTEYFYDEASQSAYHIEANPRLGMLYFPDQCGIPFSDAFLRISLGEHVDRLPDAKTGVRFHQTFLSLISEARTGASRSQLWREWQDARHQRGFYEGSEDTITRPADDFLSRIPATAVTALLLAYPKASHWLVDRTLSNVSLPPEGAQAIRNLRPL
ncbi:MAG: hypothetical protein AAF539_00755 [Planctomycetota bacterium]